MGINVDRVISFTFAIGAAFAGLGGVLYAIAYSSIWTQLGILPGLKAFVAAVLGGIGSIPGAFVGALIMGQAEAMTMSYISTPMRDAVAFTILIIVLLVKPTGLFGEPAAGKGLGGRHGTRIPLRHHRQDGRPPGLDLRPALGPRPQEALAEGADARPGLRGHPGGHADRSSADFALFSAFDQGLLFQAITMTMVALGLNLIYGFNGQFSLAQWGFYGIGAYCAADITYRWTNARRERPRGRGPRRHPGSRSPSSASGRLLRRKRGVPVLSAFTFYLIALVAVGRRSPYGSAAQIAPRSAPPLRHGRGPRAPRLAGRRSRPYSSSPSSSPAPSPPRSASSSACRS